VTKSRNLTSISMSFLLLREIVFTKSDCSATRPAITSHEGEPQFEYYNTKDTGVVFAPQAVPLRVGSPSYKVPRDLDAQKPGLATHNLPYPADGGKMSLNLRLLGTPTPIMVALADPRGLDPAKLGNGYSSTGIYLLPPAQLHSNGKSDPVPRLL
jgi:hypothetical protein